MTRAAAVAGHPRLCGGTGAAVSRSASEPPPPLPSPPSRPRSPHRAAGSGSHRCRGCAWGPPRGSPWPGSNREGAVSASPGPLRLLPVPVPVPVSPSAAAPAPPACAAPPSGRPTWRRRGAPSNRRVTSPARPFGCADWFPPDQRGGPSLSMVSVGARRSSTPASLSLWSVWAGCVRRPLAASGAGRMRKWWWWRR